MRPYKESKGVVHSWSACKKAQGDSAVSSLGGKGILVSCLLVLPIILSATTSKLLTLEFLLLFVFGMDPTMWT